MDSKNYSKNESEMDSKKHLSLGIEKILDEPNTDDFIHKINRNVFLTENYIVVDTKYRNKAYAPVDGVYSFDVVVGNDISTGAVNVANSLRNITKIRFLKPTIPFISGYLDSNYRRVCIGIKECDAQSILIGDLKAHCIFKIDDYYVTHPSNNLNVLTFDEDYQEFVFEYPIKILNKITLTVGNCKTLISVPIDSDTALVSYGSPTILTSSVPHGYDIGSTFYVNISKFVTDSSYINERINRTILATSTGANTFTVLVNTSSMIGTQTVDVYYEDRRIVVNMIITCDQYDSNLA